eukprot:s3328_g6.t1
MRDTQKAGWQFLALPAKTLADGGRGGIGVLVREPLAAIRVSDTTLPTGQVFGVEVLGLRIPLSVMCLYQRQAGQTDFLNCIHDHCILLKRGCWIVGGDFNENVHDGAVATILQGYGALLVSRGRYVQPNQNAWEQLAVVDNSVRFIDGLFYNGPCSMAPKAKERPPVGADHTIPEAVFSFEFMAGKKKFRLGRHRKRCRLHQQTQNDQEANAFGSAERWSQCLSQDVDEVWRQWCSDAETFLINAGILMPQPAEVPLGQFSIKEGGARMAPEQTHQERELRRNLRRLQEAQLLKAKGHDGQKAWEEFQQVYEPFLRPPHADAIPPLQPISAEDLQRVASKMKGTAGGMDGWDAEIMAHLPIEGWVRLAQFLTICEERGEWPQSLKTWRLCFIPKSKSEGATDALQVRPIAVGNMVYRIWGEFDEPLASNAIWRKCGP